MLVKSYLIDHNLNMNKTLNVGFVIYTEAELQFLIRVNINNTL